MSTEEQTPVAATNEVEVTKPSETPIIDPKEVEASTKASVITAETNSIDGKVEDGVVDQERVMKELDAKELYCNGSRNFLVKNYSEAADQLSQVCAIYEELYGELSDELGMPYLLYAKSLIALALDENKIIDVPDEEELEDDDDDDDEEEGADGGDDDEKALSKSTSNGATANTCSNGSASNVKLDAINAENDTEDDVKVVGKVASVESEAESTTKPANEKIKSVATTSPVLDDEKPSTSNAEAVAGEDGEEEENDAASNLQLAWEILELADKIFLRQGSEGVSNLAEVRTELANIEFENNLPEAAREDYVKALKIYVELPSKYRRAMAEIHYKIGLTYLMQQLNQEGAESLKEACKLIDDEIKELEASEEEISEKQKSKIQDMEETKQEIWAKIAEIEDTQAQNIAEVRAALDSYIKPIRATEENHDAAGSSSSSTAAAASSSSSAKPTDISHLIKRKKPSDNGEDTEMCASPAKRPAL